LTRQLRHDSSVLIAPTGLLAGWVLGTAGQLQQASLAALSVYQGWAAAAVLLLALGTFGGRLAGTRLTAVLVWLRMAALLLAGLAAGFGVTGWRAVDFQAQALNPALEGRDLDITGTVAAMPQAGEDALRFRFQVESARLEGEVVRLPPRIELGWYSGFFMGPRPQAVVTAVDTPEDMADRTETLLQLQRLPQPMRAGERWQMTVRLKAPHGNSNPHGFDYELRLWEQGIQATGSVRAGLRDTPPQQLASPDWTGLRHSIERARQSVREAIFERVANRQLAGVLAALVMGDQAAIERADWDVFRATGVAHLISISGLHITLFAWLASRLLGALWRGSTRLTPALCLACPASSVAAWGGLALAVAYAAFSGWGLPAQRTVWMLAVVVALRQSGRHWAWPHVWLLAMAVVVVFDPWALLQAGFWLSFVAVGVLFAADRGPAEGAASGPEEAAALRPWWRSAADRLVGMLREQWVITLALTPMTLLLFNQVSVVGLLANALAIPWVTLLVTPLALLGVIVPPLWGVAAWLTGVLVSFLQVLAAWPMATISQAAVPLWCALAGVVGGLLLVMRLPWHWRALGVPLLLPVLLWQPLRPAAGDFELLAADIGQGNAVLVRTAQHALLYDAGPRFSRESDAGHRVLVPLLRALGERLDWLVLSHRDADHVGGAAAVLAMQPQAGLLSSIEDTHELQLLRPGQRCLAGQRWQWDGVDFEMLHPGPADYEGRNKSNAMSCVLRISAGPAGRRVHALLGGDMELAQEQSLLHTAEVSADFLLMPHHGSKTSSSGSFLDAVQPRLALAQAGYRNRFGHPAAPVLERYRERAIPVLQSPACGALSWQSARPAEWTCQRELGLRYWQHRLPVSP
jgi:competence protein ComEC